jgi:hypothetical protein
MQSLLQSARFLVSDLASTILFLIVLLITKDLILAVALGVGLGVVQISWLMVRRKPIDSMQWLSVGLVVASGMTTMLTNDARFVMLKPSVIYCIAGAFMLRPGWMNRYLPALAIQLVARADPGSPDLVCRAVGLGHRKQDRALFHSIRHDAHDRSPSPGDGSRSSTVT